MIDLNQKKVILLSKLLSYPVGFNKNPTYTEIGCDRCRAVWGTKWDAIEQINFESANIITIFYQTAWDPTINWVRNLCEFIRAISLLLDKQVYDWIMVKHFFCKENTENGLLMTWTNTGNEFTFLKMSAFPVKHLDSQII